MSRPRICRALLCLCVLSFAVAARAENEGQDLLDKATDIKLSAENSNDLNEVVRLCEEAIKAGLDDGNTQFANGLLASTLSQRAELVCLELFERPVTPGRARKLVAMALADLDATLKIDPEQPEAQYLLGRLNAHLGETKKAMAALDEAVRLSDDAATKAKALMIRANLHKNPDKERADYDEAVKLMPGDANVLRFRGMYHLTHDELEPAIADFDAAIAADPKDAETFEARGIALALAHRLDEAMDSFTKTIALEPASSNAFTQRGRIRAIKGDITAALNDVEQALKLQPRSAAALQLRASLLTSIGKYDEALADLTVLRKSMPDNADVLLQLAGLYHVSKKPDLAVATYGQAIEADPKSAAGYRGRADAYLSLGKQAEAVADYEAALAIDPKNSGVLNNLAWLMATSPEQSLRNGKRSIELAKLACEVTEYKQAHILSTLAAAYAETGDFDEAMSWSQKAVKLGTDQLKGQLTKELKSYQAHQPWREATPPEIEFDDEQAVSPEKANSPASDDTARTKQGN